MCFTEFRSNSACPDEIMIVSLHSQCDLGVKSKAGTERSYLLFLLILTPYIEEKFTEGC